MYCSPVICPAANFLADAMLRAAVLSNAGRVAGAYSASTGLVAFLRHMVARTAFLR